MDRLFQGNALSCCAGVMPFFAPSPGSVGEDPSEEGRRVSAKKERTASGLILQPRERKEKKEKKEKETRYAHLGEDPSSGEDEADGK